MRRIHPRPRRLEPQLVQSRRVLSVRRSSTLRTSQGSAPAVVGQSHRRASTSLVCTELRRTRRAHVPDRDPRPDSASPTRLPSRPRPCPTRWPGATCSAGAAPAPARPTRSCCRWSPGSRRAAARLRRAPRALILAPTRELVGQIHDVAQAAGQGRRPDHPDRLRRRRPEPAGPGPAPRRRHRAGLPRPARGPDRPGPLLASARSRSPSSTRPTTWPTSASCPPYAACSTRPRGTASGCCSRPRSTRRSTCWSSGSSTSRSPTRPTRCSRRSRRWTTTCCTSAASTGSRCWSTSPARPAARSSSPAPSTAPRRSPASSTAAVSRRVELHGNLSQNARTRNMEAFHSGKAATLVATDIAARGIHVDDVALVIHADPPVEHKAYLHRSGRTARAGAAGTVVTLMTDEQVRDVRVADPRRRHQADDHQDPRVHAPGPRRARSGRTSRRPRRHRRRGAGRRPVVVPADRVRRWWPQPLTSRSRRPGRHRQRERQRGRQSGNGATANGEPQREPVARPLRCGQVRRRPLGQRTARRPSAPAAADVRPAP